MNEFIIQWYSRSIFNFQPSEIKQLFRKIETKFKQLITNNLHQEFNNIYILYIFICVCIFYCNLVFQMYKSLSISDLGKLRCRVLHFAFFSFHIIVYLHSNNPILLNINDFSFYKSEFLSKVCNSLNYSSCTKKQL